MKLLWPLTRVVVLAILLLAMLAAGAPAAGARPHAAPNAQTEPNSVALKEAVSPATGHLFILSQDFRSSTLYTSAVSMLDARTGKLLHVTPAGHYAGWLLVDDASHHVFVVKGGVLPDQSSEPVSVLVLDTRTGALLRTIGHGSGQIQRVTLARQVGELYVAVTPDAATGPGSLRVLDTRTCAIVHTLPLQQGDTEFVTHQASSTLFVINTAGTVRLYDTHTWKLKATVRLEEPTMAVADEMHGLVAIVTGKQHTTITFVDPSTGAVARTLSLKASSQIAYLVLDDQTDHLFVIFFGGYAKSEPVTGPSVTIVGGEDGLVTTVDRASGTVLRTQPVGFVALYADVDARTQHLFVWSYERIGTRTGRVTISSSLVSMLDTRTGALVRATKIPFAPDPEFRDLVVDAQAGRAYVTSIPQLQHGQWVINTVMLLDTRTGAVVRIVTLPEPSA